MNIFKKKLKDIDKLNDKIEESSNCISIFDKDYFTLKELCNLFLLLSNKINYISDFPSDIIKSFSIDYYKKIILDRNVIDNDEIYFIYQCYMNFSRGNEKYRNFLRNTRHYKGAVLINNKEIYFREILQLFDNHFNKLVIRINCELLNYDISISWEQFENKVKKITKKELEEIIKNIKN